MYRFRVTSRHFQYDVVVGQGAWRALRAFNRGKYSSVFVLTERALWNRWAAFFLRESGLQRPRVLFIPSGEGSKSLSMAGHVASQLSDSGADRRSLLVALGGGVVGDLGGFVASTYMRGIDLIHVPTTILAQVDSSIGGKTAVNVGATKNLVGTFYPPRLVASDPTVLSSMGARAFRSGLYEVVKHAILSGPRFYRLLDGALDSMRAENAGKFSKVVAEAAKVKVSIANRDEREARLRMVLNLGHTFGHALEEATGYGRFLHGEAVGWGLLAAIRLGETLGLTGERDAALMSEMVRRVGPLPHLRGLSAEKVARLLSRDKKTLGGRLHWIIPERIGKVRIVADVPPAIATDAFREIQRSESHD